MLVYRVCAKEEIDKIFNNVDFSNIGCIGEDFIKYQKIKDINNHKYDPNKLYLHFFDNIWSVAYWKSTKDNYICTYDIPDDILNEGFGIGKYLSPISESMNKVSLIEYAIESEKIKKEYLIRVELITSDIDFTDDDYTEEMDDNLSTIYEREPRKYQYKRKQISDEETKRLIKELQKR